MRRVKWNIGDTIDSQYGYRIDAVKEGGMGTVLICYSTRLKTTFALKTFKDEFLDSKEARHLFAREALVWLQLGSHPNILRAYAVDSIHGRPFITLEYVPGNRNTLTNRLKDLSYPDCLQFAIQICSGMQHAHKHGIGAHRDIKPDNIMVTPDGCVKITDFGLSRVPTGSISSRTVTSSLTLYKTMRGMAAGTPPYMSPEQFEDAASAGVRSDIYSFGVVLYQMQSGGVLPFYCNSLEEYYDAHRTASLPQISSPLSAIIKRCMRRQQPEFTSFKEIIEDLVKLGAQPPTAVESEPDALELAMKAASLCGLGKYEDAIPYFKAAIKMNRDDVVTWNNYGYALFRLGEYDSAITCFDKALEMEDTYYIAIRNKANALSRLGKIDEAIQSYNSAIDIQPQDSWNWHDLALALIKAGKFRKALDCESKATLIDPWFLDAHVGKGRALYELGRFEEAIACFDAALQLNSNFLDAMVNKAGALAALRRNSEALKILDDAIALQLQETSVEISYSVASCWVNKGAILEKTGKHEEALQCFEEALKICADHATAWYNKALVLAKFGKKSEAAECMEEYRKLTDSGEGS